MNANDYMHINRTALKLAGLYPVNIFRCTVCILCQFLIIVPQVAQIYRHQDDLNSVLETSSVLFTITLALLKSIVWIISRREIEFFINYMLTDYGQLVPSDDTVQQLIVYATFFVKDCDDTIKATAKCKYFSEFDFLNRPRYARNVTKGYFFLICNALIFFCSLPMIDKLILILKGSKNSSNSNNFPFLAWYPNLCYNSPYYELTYISQLVATGICGIMILATDTLIVTALLHTSGHFKVLQKELEHLDTNINRLVNAGSNSKYYAIHIQTIKSRVGRIVKHHQSVLWFCGKMEMNFSPMLLVQTLASSLIICLIALQLSTTLTDRAKIVKYLSYLVMALFQLVMFCFPGDILLQQSFAVNKAAYSIRWYNTAALLRAEVLLLILRAQKPSQVTAGGFYVMHLENFNMVLSKAMSYFMLIRNINMENSHMN